MKLTREVTKLLKAQTLVNKLQVHRYSAKLCTTTNTRLGDSIYCNTNKLACFSWEPGIEKQYIDWYLKSTGYEVILYE